VEEPGTEQKSVQQEARTCPTCGTKFFATTDSGLCPLCILRTATDGESTAVEAPSSVSGSADSSEEASAGVHGRRYANYELMLDKGGRPIELGRGDRGVTYKAFDVDLRCPVTLKLIGERHLGDEAARRGFLREARAAASLRHPNVASVLRFGRSAKDLFYATEFVQGETLGSLIKRSGRLKVKLALEIAAQVAAGLAAVHKQNLVHRDIKPTNVMVSVDEESTVTAKIIELGLAKRAIDASGEAAISVPGAFAGTPEFASPEQFAGVGVGVDIRSDLYSLGVMIWQMLTGRTPFRGTAAEVMYQHQHAPLPLEQLDGVPRPVVVMLECKARGHLSPAPRLGTSL